MKKDTKATSFRLPPDILEWCKKQDRSATDIVTGAVRLYMHLDYKKLEALAFIDGFEPGKLINVLMDSYDQLSKKEKAIVVNKHF